MLKKKLKTKLNQITLRRSSSMIMLELLIAVALIGLFSSNIIFEPTKVYMTQLLELEELELERIADNLYLEIYQTFKDKHPWDTLTDTKAVHNLPPITLELGPHSSIPYDASYKIWIRRQKESPSSTNYRLIGLELHFKRKQPSLGSLKKKPLKFHYAFLLQKLPKNHVEL